MTQHAPTPRDSASPTAHDADTAGRLARAALSVVAAACVAAFGVNVFFGLGFGPLVSFGPIAGLIAALACGSVLDAAAAGAVNAVAGTLLAQAVFPHPWPATSGWVGTMLTVALVAAVVGAGAAWVLGRSPNLTTVFSALALALILAACTLNGLTTAAQPRSAVWVTGAPGSALSLSDALNSPATQSAVSPDETIYLFVVQQLARGSSYYPSMVQALADDNRVHTDGNVPLDQPTSYRMPTLFWVLAALPQSGAIPLVELCLGALAAVGAYLLARRFVVAPLALVGATGVAAYTASIAATPAVLYVELWAGLLGLIAVAVFVRSRQGTRVTMVLQLAAAFAALLAALVRELAVGFVAAGTIATLADPELRRKRVWIAWAGALALALAAFALHWRSALAAFSASGAPSGSVSAAARFPWFHPDGSGLVYAARLTQAALQWNAVAVYAAIAVCVLGALIIEGDLGTRVTLGLTCAAGVALLAIVRAPGVNADSVLAGYWGMVVVPTALACFPLAFSRLDVARAETARPDESAAGATLGHAETQADGGA